MRKLYLLICVLLIALGTTRLYADDPSSTDGGHAGASGNPQEAVPSGKHPLAPEGNAASGPATLEQVAQLQQAVDVGLGSVRGVNASRNTGEVTSTPPAPNF